VLVHARDSFQICLDSLISESFPVAAHKHHPIAGATTASLLIEQMHKVQYTSAKIPQISPRHLLLKAVKGRISMYVHHFDMGQSTLQCETANPISIYTYPWSKSLVRAGRMYLQPSTRTCHVPHLGITLSTWASHLVVSFHPRRTN
jgi:hypothetical protein